MLIFINMIYIFSILDGLAIFFVKFVPNVFNTRMTFLISSIIRTMLNMTFLYGSVNFLSIWCSLLSFVVSALFGRHLGSRGVFMQRSSVIFYLLRLVANIVSYFLYKTNYIKMFTKYDMLQTFYLFDFVRVLCLTMLNISNKKLTITYPFEKGPLSLRFRGHLPTQLVANIVSYFLYKMHYLYSKICHVEPI